MSPNSCGCVTGAFLCPTAEALWAAVNAQWEAAKVTRKYADYDAAMDAYCSHGVAVREP